MLFGGEISFVVMWACPGTGYRRRTVGAMPHPVVG